MQRAAATLLDSAGGVVAVLGHEADAVGTALEELATRHDESYAVGQSTSVAAGVGAARERGWDAAVFALGDMPLVDSETGGRLLTAYADGAGAGVVLAPAHEGVRGDPVRFDEDQFGALAAVTGDRGGREIVEEVGTLVSVDDPGVHRDVDRRRTLEDS